jgi:integration host factor subunit alpha
LRGLSVLNVKTKRERQGRNPRTGEAVIIDARRVLRFRASGLLLTRLNRRATWLKLVPGLKEFISPAAD